MNKKIVKNNRGKIIILVVLIIFVVLRVLKYKNIINIDKTENVTEKVEVENKQNTKLLSGKEIQKMLEPEEAFFCIENIVKADDEYTITAYMLEDTSRVITKEEYEKLLNGGEIEFRNLKWKKDNSVKFEIEDGFVIKADENKKLAIIYDKTTEEGIFENVAGAKTEGLRDFSNHTIEFKVSKNILIGNNMFTRFEYDNNGKVRVYDSEEKEIKEYKGLTVDELLNISKTKTGSYQECRALVRNGNVDVIQILAD